MPTITISYSIIDFSKIMFLSISSFLCFLCFPVIFLFLVRNGWKKKGDAGARRPLLPPGPPKLPIMGNLHQLGELPHRSLWKFSKEFGPLMMLQLGSIPTLVASSADTAKQVLKTHDADCCGRHPWKGTRMLSYNFLDIAFSPPSDYRTAMRRVFVHELVSEKKARSSRRAREAEVNRLIASLSEAAASSPVRPVDLHERIVSLTDGILNMFAFGKSYGGKQFKNVKCQDVLSEAMKMMHSFSAEQFFPSVGWIIDAFIGVRARQNRCLRSLDDYFQTLIDQHLDPTMPPKSSDSEEEEEDLVDVLLRLSKDGKFGFHLTHDHIKAILMDAFIGGTDSTTVTIMWAMSELVANPRVMKKVQAEIRSCVGRKGKVEMEDLPRLKYLKMVLKESFRMHPPAPTLVPHQTMRHCKISANDCIYDIPPQTTILINAFAIGRDPESWKNPNEFYPERFEGSEIDYKGHHFELLPFGSGRRICPGIALAMPTVEFTLASLLYCFDWELPVGMKTEDIDMEESGDITLYRKTPLLVVPIKSQYYPVGY